MHLYSISSISNFIFSYSFFSLQLDVAVQEIKDGTPIKKLLLLLDLARQGQGEEETAVSLAKWTKVIQDLSLS